MKRKTWLRGIAACGIGAVALALSGWLYWRGFELDRLPPPNPAATSGDLAFLADPAPPRGRMLAVVSSAPRLANGRRGGYELTELARAYYVFEANGYRVDIASPGGGEPPAMIDDDLGDADHAFLNDPLAQRKVTASIALAEVDPTHYAGVFFVGGKGAMVDFPGNPDIARIVAAIDATGGVVGAVCHGPAALVGLPGADGRPWLDGRRVTGFSNDEELFLIEDARTVFPWLLQERLAVDGARYAEGPMYLDHIVVDGRLVTGQNPWSTWSAAEAMVRALGHEPVAREVTGEEHAVRVLAEYRRNGSKAARELSSRLPQIDRRLVLLHALIAAMRGEWLEAWKLQRLAR